MNKITKITNSNNKIIVYHSDNVIDKRTHYDIQFDSFYKGYVDYYVKKEIVQCKKPQADHLTCVMYLSTNQYKEDPDKWVKIFKDFYSNKYGNYKWYTELIEVR